MKYLVPCIAFFVAAFGFGWLFSLFSRLPGFGTIPEWVLSLATALLACGIATVIGQRFTTTKRSLIIATVCLAAFMVFSFVPKPPHVVLPPPSAVPEGYVEFYYQASFTFLGGETSTISNVELWLPWPYIDTKETRPLAKPVGLDNWLHVRDGHYSASGPHDLYSYLVNVLKPSKEEINILENDGIHLHFGMNIENGVWSADRIINHAEVENLKIVYEGQQAPSITAYFERAQDKTIAMFQKIIVEVPVMFSSDTVVVKYQFLVPEENASKVRVDDWIYSYTDWILSGAYEKGKTCENSPVVFADYAGGSIRCKFTVSLWKNTDGSSFFEVATYQKEWNSWRPGFRVLS
ncbi:MAG: hypothetical protein H5T49_00505 [Hadesarchaea archaeon]|nr:hypothetical protein [Hadesarchaea archaeon]